MLIFTLPVFLAPFGCLNCLFLFIFQLALLQNLVPAAAAFYFHSFGFLDGCEGCKLKVVASTLKSVQLCVFCSLLVPKFGFSWRFLRSSVLDSFLLVV